MIVLLLACGAPVVEVPDLDVSATVSDVNASGGVLTVTSVYRGEGITLPDAPEVEGLTFSLVGDPRQETLGGRTVVTQVWRFSGKKGSYEITPLVVATPGGEEAKSSPLWVDMGVEAPKMGELGDIVEPGPVWSFPWGWLACGLGGLFGLLVAAVVAGRRATRPRARAAVKLPPDVRWLRAWELVRMNPTLTDEDRARELSRIFREYTEEVLGFPAVSWTTTEILDQLAGMIHLQQGNVPRAKRLLRATDLVKYAEVRPGEDFFDGLDGDLRAFVASTRPTTLQPPPGEVPVG